MLCPPPDKPHWRHLRYAVQIGEKRAHFDSPLEVDYFLNTKYNWNEPEEAQEITILQLEHDSQFGWKVINKKVYTPQQAYQRLQWSLQHMNIVEMGGPTLECGDKRKLADEWSDERKYIKV